VRSELTQKSICVDEPAGFDVLVGLGEGLMQGSTILVVEPITGIERQELAYPRLEQSESFGIFEARFLRKSGLFAFWVTRVRREASRARIAASARIDAG